MTHQETNTLDELHTKVIHEFSKTLEMFALTPAEARLFATLYIHDSPMTLDEMSVALGKSKTSMSTGIRTLVDLNLVERVWKKGVRKDLYKADKNLYKKFITMYIQKWIDATDRQDKSLHSLKEDIDNHSQKNEGQSEEAKEIYHKIEAMTQFHSMVYKTFKEMAPMEISKS
ncbi:GbsR/MarR family transcriptional regulator [Thalassobacillus hwangdonensis]|uniref:HTH-type transcriptional regulator n=1 Tax=Thalassobacillus hwangdonensis TaxID=546108 RepID=A0ABW3KX99_9BACI